MIEYYLYLFLLHCKYTVTFAINISIERGVRLTLCVDGTTQHIVSQCPTQPNIGNRKEGKNGGGGRPHQTVEHSKYGTGGGHLKTGNNHAPSVDDRYPHSHWRHRQLASLLFVLKIVG